MRENSSFRERNSRFWGCWFAWARKGAGTRAGQRACAGRTGAARAGAPWGAEGSALWHSAAGMLCIALRGPKSVSSFDDLERLSSP